MITKIRGWGVGMQQYKIIHLKALFVSLSKTFSNTNHKNQWLNHSSCKCQRSGDQKPISVALVVGLSTPTIRPTTQPLDGREPLCIFIKCFTKFIKIIRFTIFYRGFYNQQKKHFLDWSNFIMKPVKCCKYFFVKHFTIK